MTNRPFWSFPIALILLLSTLASLNQQSAFTQESSLTEIDDPLDGDFKRFSVDALVIQQATAIDGKSRVADIPEVYAAIANFRSKGVS